MKTLLNGAVTLNLSVLTDMSVGESKLQLHPESIIGGKLILKLPNGQELSATVNEFFEFELEAIDPVTGIEIEDADFIQ